jgi:translation initiation factor IF-3
MRPRTDEHDVEVKTRKIQEFLAEGDKVRVSVQFRGAEMRHPDIGRKLLDSIADVLKGTAVIEKTPSMEGRMMSMIVSRAPGWEPPKKQAAPAEKSRSHPPASGKVTNAQKAADSSTPPKPALVADTSEAANSQAES